MPEVCRRTGTEIDSEFIFECIKCALGPYVVQTFGPWDEQWQRDYFRRTTNPTTHEILELNGEPVGCLLVSEADDRLDLHRILILPAFQNRGIGSRVIADVLQFARAKGKPVRLQVFRVNPARRLYERMGFVLVGETPDSYVLLAG